MLSMSETRKLFESYQNNLNEGIEEDNFIKQCEESEQFDYNQMYEIEKGFEDGLSLEQVQLYAKPEFDDDQMEEIREGLSSGLSIEQILSHINSKTKKSGKKYDNEDDEEYYDLVVTYDDNKKILFYKLFEVGSEEPYIEKFDEVQEAISVADKNKNATAVIIWDCTGSDDLLIWTKKDGELDELEEPNHEYYTDETRKLINKITEDK